MLSHSSYEGEIQESHKEVNISSDFIWYPFAFARRKVRTWKWHESFSFLRIFYLNSFFFLPLLISLVYVTLSLPLLIPFFFFYFCFVFSVQKLSNVFTLYLIITFVPCLYSPWIPTLFPIPRCFGHYIPLLFLNCNFSLFPSSWHSHIFLFFLISSTFFLFIRTIKSCKIKLSL
jgi:hypothetical protein